MNPSLKKHFFSYANFQYYFNIVLEEWMAEYIADTYVSVDDANKDCNFANKWIKE